LGRVVGVPFGEKVSGNLAGAGIDSKVEKLWGGRRLAA